MKIISMLLCLWLLSESAYASDANTRTLLAADPAAAGAAGGAAAAGAAGGAGAAAPGAAAGAPGAAAGAPGAAAGAPGAAAGAPGAAAGAPGAAAGAPGGVPACGIIDIVANCGAQPNGDVTQILTKAFLDACASPTAATIVIPAGVFNLGQINFTGPCKAPITFQLDGTLKAPADPTVFKESKWVSFCHVNFLTLTGTGIFDGNGVQAWASSGCEGKDSCAGMPINVRFDFLNHTLVTGITSQDSKNFNFNLLCCDNLTFDKVKVVTAPGSMNTDGIHVGKSKFVKIIDTALKTGDDCISIGDGVTDMEVSKVTCGPGHGISIGSLGKYQDEVALKGIHIRDCQLTDTTNGARLKSWPGCFPNTCDDVLFEAITMTNVSNPIILDQCYCPHGKCKQGEPTLVKMTNVIFRNIKGSSACHDAVQLLCSPGMCENIELADVDITYQGPKMDNFSSFCSNIKPKITPPLNPPGPTCV